VKEMDAQESRNPIIIEDCGYWGPDCSVDKALDAIGGKWSFLVIRELLQDTRRFGELQRSIHWRTATFYSLENCNVLFIGELQRSIQKISAKSLAVTLYHLENNGILVRTVHPTNPPTVAYALTAKGEALRPIIYAMKHWGKHWT
jgi:DNA-binding HxlR family transcriptional regulator